MHVELVFNVDFVSLNTIKKCKFLLDYKFGTAPLWRKNLQKSKSLNQAANNQGLQSLNKVQNGDKDKEVEQTEAPIEVRKNNGDEHSASNRYLQGPSRIRSTFSSKILEGTSNTVQQSPGSKTVMGSQRNATNSSRAPSTINQSKTDSKKALKVDILGSKKSLGDRKTNQEGLKAPQKSDVPSNTQNGQ